MAITNYRFTVDDLPHLPDDGCRYEVIDGELYVTAAPHFEHQAALDQLIRALGAWHDITGLGWSLSGAGLIFSFDNGVVPDLVWVANDNFAHVFTDPKTGRRDGKLHAAPDLAVEILSPGRVNEERDREIKLKLYSRRGVKEYWIVDRDARAIEVYRRTEAAILELAMTVLVGDTLASPLLPGFALPVERVFRLPPGLPA